MDPNLLKMVQDFKEKQQNYGSTIDCVELEKSFREFKTELYIKRDEVNQLRTELDTANLEIQNLKKALDTTKQVLDEGKFNLTIQVKRAHTHEEELHQKRETLMKSQLQLKMAVAEVSTLRENLQKTEMEKMELCRKVDIFETKQRHNSLYHDEILKRDNQLRNVMEHINEMITKLQIEHAESIELSKKTQLATETLEKLKSCTTENEQLRKKKEQFEEMYVKVNAKFEKLEELMAINSNVNKPNLLTKTIFNQWKLTRIQNEKDARQRNEILDKMTESLSNERITNIKLIRQNENIKELNKKLEEENLKLQVLSKQNTDNIKVLNEKIKSLERDCLVKSVEIAMEQDKIQIKEEPIEIDD